jgi:hypothetical protein
MGSIATDVDFEALMDAARFAAGIIGSELPSYTLKAGRSKW